LIKDEKFKIIQFIRELIIIIDKELDNFPKKDIELKNRIRNLSFDILELAYEANSVSNLEKRKEFVQMSICQCHVNVNSDGVF